MLDHCDAVVRTKLVTDAGGGFHWLDAAAGFGVAIVCVAALVLALGLAGIRSSHVRGAA
ncbi:MAG TPA: hypothetical protein VH297_01145 [Gaiellaceae bacterium]|jgi:hypothetical protein